MAIAMLTCAPLGTAADAKAKSGSGAGGNKIGQAGTIELGLSGHLDVLQKGAPIPNYIETKLGYFALPGIEIGLNLLEGSTATGERNTAGIFAEYDYTGMGMMVPAFGLGLNHTAAPADTTGGKDAREAVIYGGLSLTLAPNVALASLLDVTIADNKVLGYVGERTNKQVDMKLQMRFFF